MKTKHLIITAVVAASLSVATLVTSNSVSLSAYNPSLSWWENNCVMPEGYTSIKDIVTNGSDDEEYTTRGTVTSVESKCYFIQSQGYAIEIYTAPGDIQVGNVVDVTGQRDTYKGTIELTGATASVIAESNPYPVEAFEINESNVASALTTANVSRYVQMTDLVFGTAPGSNMYLECNGKEVQLYPCGSKTENNAIKSYASDAYNENPVAIYTFTGILGVYSGTYQLRILDVSQFRCTGSTDTAPTSVTVAPGSYQMHVGEERVFTTTVLPKYTTDKSVTWSCTGGSITQDGVYTATATGTYTVTATSTVDDTVLDTATVTVTAASSTGVVYNPTQTGDVLGPLYVPEMGDSISLSFLEMSVMYGDSILFDYGDFEMLIDGGARDDKDTVMAALADKVDDGQIEVMINTHPHVDHFGGLSYYDSYYSEAGVSNVKYLIDCGGTYSTTNYADWDYTRSQFLATGTTRYTNYEMIYNSESGFPNVLEITNDITLKFLDTGNYVPAGSKISDANTASIAAILMMGNTRYFLTGDNTNVNYTGSEHALLENYSGTGLWSEDTLNIVKANHHGSNSSGSNSQEWVDGTMPDYVIISAAIMEANRTPDGVTGFQHPTVAATDRYLTATENIYWNGINGTITFNHSSPSAVPTMSFAGRTIDYYDSRTGEIVDREAERTIKYIDSVFYITRDKD